MGPRAAMTVVAALARATAARLRSKPSLARGPGDLAVDCDRRSSDAAARRPRERRVDLAGGLTGALDLVAVGSASERQARLGAATALDDADDAAGAVAARRACCRRRRRYGRRRALGGPAAARRLRLRRRSRRLAVWRGFEAVALVLPRVLVHDHGGRAWLTAERVPADDLEPGELSGTACAMPRSPWPPGDDATGIDAAASVRAVPGAGRVGDGRAPGWPVRSVVAAGPRWCWRATGRRSSRRRHRCRGAPLPRRLRRGSTVFARRPRRAAASSGRRRSGWSSVDGREVVTRGAGRDDRARRDAGGGRAAGRGAAGQREEARGARDRRARCCARRWRRSATSCRCRRARDHASCATCSTWSRRCAASSARRPGVLDLVERLHPTPAVGGMPPRPALELIASASGSSAAGTPGRSAGSTRDGDGEFAVALRSALCAGARRRLFAGCGIMADSDPAAEWPSRR